MLYHSSALLWVYFIPIDVSFQNEPNKVLDDCTESLKLNQRYTKALMRRAKAAERLKNIDLSLEDLACACILEYFRNSENLAELDRIAKATGRAYFFKTLPSST